MAILFFILFITAICLEAFATVYRVPKSARSRNWRSIEGDPVSRRIGLGPAFIFLIIAGLFGTLVLLFVPPISLLDWTLYYILFGAMIFVILERFIVASWNFHLSRHQKWRYTHGRWYKRWED